MNRWYRMKRNFPIILILFYFLAACTNPLSLIESASDEIDFKMDSSSCRDEQWVVPGGAEIDVRLTNPLDVPQIFIVMARAATPPFDSLDEDRIFFSVPVTPGYHRDEFYCSSHAVGIPGYLRTC